MNLLAFVFSYARGLKLKYLGAMFCIVAAALFSFMNPLIIRFCIDSVLGGRAVDMPLLLPNPGEGFIAFIRGHFWVAGLAVVLMASMAHGCTYLRGKLSAKVGEEFARRMREALFGHIQKLPYAWHSRIQTGDIIQRCTSDVDTLRRFISLQAVQLGRGLFMICLIIPVMLSLDTTMTLFANLAVPVVFTYAYIFFRKISKLFKAQDEAEGYMTTMLEESISGIRVVKAFAREDYEIERFGYAAKDYRDKSRKLITVLSWYWSSSDQLCMMQIALVLVVGSIRTINGLTSLGTTLAFVSYSNMLIWPIREMGRILTDMGRARVSATRLKEIIDTPQEDMRGITPGAGQKLKGAIDFKDLSFAYDQGSDILCDIDLSIAAGETIVILGATGAGKSTLTNLIPRLFDYDRGQIFIDGIELNKYDRQYLRGQIGLVLQEPFLYARALYDNIAFREGMTREQAIQASKDAAFHDAVSDFEYGYDTVIGERGITLSGGQRQRCAIARALIQDAPILILDDALSAVDTDTEEQILDNLKRRKGRATTIIITHRLSSVSLADRIVVLEHGKIVQIGTHSDLVKVPGVYQRIWNIQHQLEQEAG
ncbi:MAG: ABC transporter ATP-binding protein [Candidatus Cloacimonetes bacterium]|nr:ABC transporter ATP-binding protein [Candidatus Cloacimonadota bacterium]